MKKKITEAIEDYMEDLNADGYRKGKSWKGYDVYVVTYLYGHYLIERMNGQKISV